MDSKALQAESFDATQRLLELLKGRWRFAILRSLSARSPQRLAELRRSLPEISKKVLLDNLSVLQEAGMLDRQDLSTKVKRVEYSLTEAGRMAIARLLAMSEDPKGGA